MSTSAPSLPTISLLGRPVPRIGYGMGRASHSAETPAAYDRSLAALRLAVEQGVRLFDTAQFYDDGRANRLLRESVGARRDEVVYASKVGARPVTDGPVPMTAAQRPHELRAAVEENLRTLGTDRLDIALLRRMDMKPGLIVEGDQAVPVADQLAELITLRDEGKILGIGLSHVTLETLQEALPAGIVAVSNIYSLVVREHESLLDICAREGIAWIPFFPLGGGGSASSAELPLVVDDETVQAVARELDATPAQVGAAWMLHHAPTSVMISGSISPGHIRENVAAVAIRLSDEQLARLDAVAPPR